MSAIDNGNFVLLSLLEVSAAIDCVDHEILLNRLDHSFCIQFKVLKWLTSYLTGQTRCVHGITLRCWILSSNSCHTTDCGYAVQHAATLSFHEIVWNLAREHSPSQTQSRGIIYRYLLGLHLPQHLRQLFKRIQCCLLCIEKPMIVYASIITICFCKAPLRCLHLRHFINCQYYITFHL